MFRRIFWINLGLLVIVFLLGLNVYKLWLSVIKEEWKKPIAVSAMNVSENEVTFGEEDISKPALYTYDVIADKDLFRPERTEWLPPLPETEESEKKEMIPQYPAERHQPAMKEPTLYGVMIRGDNKSALLKGSIREEPKQRSRKVRLGNGEVREVPLPPIPGRVVDDKVRTYHLGDEINESIIVDILPDRVVLSKNGEEYELLLREPTRLAAKNAPTPGQESPNTRGDQEGEDQEGLQTASPRPGQFPNFPRPPAYIPPQAFPGFQPPQDQGDQPVPGFPAFPPGAVPPGAVPGVPLQPPFPQFPRQGPVPGYAPAPGYPNRAGPGSPFFRPLVGGN